MKTLKNPFKITPVFEWNYKSKSEIVVNQGGTNSGKTYSILQVLFMRAHETANTVVTVVGQDVPNLKKGAIKDALSIANHAFFKKMLIEHGAYNRQDRILRFKNGSYIEFTSFADAQDAHSGKRDYAFFNEADGIAFSVYEQVEIRTAKQTFIDYNPTAKFWVHREILENQNEAARAELFISNYSHNPFIKPKIKRQIESWKTSKDKNFWNVYGLGKTGRIQELVLSAEVCDDFPVHVRNIGLGLDFGFSKDPSALMLCGYSDNKLYVKELIYERGLTTPDLIQRMRYVFKTTRLSRNTPIYADSANPDSITQIKRAGFIIRGAKKGSGSIIAGLDLIKARPLLATRSSYNFLAETMKYKHKRDKRTNEVLNEVIDAHNHAIDAVRYYVSETNVRPTSNKPRFSFSA